MFDRVTPQFGKDVLRVGIELQGDLNKAAEVVLTELAAFKDAAGYICDDNLTLSIIGTRVPPKLCAGFWNHTAP